MHWGSAAPTCPAAGEPDLSSRPGLRPGRRRVGSDTRSCQLHRPALGLLALCLLLLLGCPASAAQPVNTSCPNSPLSKFVYGRVRLPALKVETVLKSTRPRKPEEITICTQCSVDRLYMLREQCKSWMGITSVAVYFPLIYFQPDNDQRLQEAISTVKQWHTSMEAEGFCRLDVVVVSEVIKQHELWAYPYNALRNQAVSRAETEVLLLLDADFVVSKGLHEKLSEEKHFRALVEDTVTHRAAIVLPAFETDAALSADAGGQTAFTAQQGSKEALKAMFDARNVIQFAEFYPVGHRSTNYKKFFDTAEPYAIRFKSGYEPYVLVSRKHMPWYDERFRGYGWDKVMQIYQMDAMNFRFMGHPSAWVVHRPHAPSSGYNHTFTGEAYTQKHKPTDHLWKMERIAKDMMAELRVGSYPEAGVTSLQDCRRAVQGQPTVNRDQVWW